MRTSIGGCIEGTRAGRSIGRIRRGMQSRAITRSEAGSIEGMLLRLYRQLQWEEREPAFPLKEAQTCTPPRKAHHKPWHAETRIQAHRIAKNLRNHHNHLQRDLSLLHHLRVEHIHTNHTLHRRGTTLVHDIPSRRLRCPRRPPRLRSNGHDRAAWSATCSTPTMHITPSGQETTDATSACVIIDDQMYLYPFHLDNAGACSMFHPTETQPESEGLCPTLAPQTNQAFHHGAFV